jgi:dTDP-glucose pyrophosphorylase
MNIEARIENFWRQAILSSNSSIQEAIRILDQTGIKIVLVTTEDNRLEGTISDGDIRRGLLKGLNLDSHVATIIHRNALVVPPGIGRETIMQLMVANKLQQIPVVDESRHIVGLHLWDEITAPPQRSNLMVVMAGGKGIRLRPFTESCPKPLVKVAGKPMLEHIIERARLEGFNHFVLAINYLGQMIEDHFGNGEQLGVSIEYLREEEPLGTAGALSLLDSLSDSPIVVTNADIITDIRYGELLDFHIHHEAAATMAVRMHEWQNPFGVVQTQGIDIAGFEEKPVMRNHINAGVYVVNPDALKNLTRNEHCDMPSLFEAIKIKGHRIVAYPMHEPWLDVGRPDDLRLANTKNND